MARKNMEGTIVIFKTWAYYKKEMTKRQTKKNRNRVWTNGLDKPTPGSLQLCTEDELATQQGLLCLRKKQVTLSMATGNVGLVHECFPTHLHSRIARMK